MSAHPPRIATLVLVDERGVVLGALAPFEAETPWWNDMGPVVREVLARHGVRVTVLRMLHADLDASPGGAMTYLAQLDAGSPNGPLRPWAGALPEDPLRARYAHVGGPQADLAWAMAIVKARGGSLTGEPAQIRTWNLSSLWRLPTTLGPLWLKAVPSFFAHEGDILELLIDAPVPRLLGHDGGRILLADIDGTDRHHAELPECLLMIDLLVTLQSAWLGRSGELIPLGLPDWRGPALTRALVALVARRAGELELPDRSALEGFVGGLPERFAAIAACGIPEGLVHGDFHTGNLRGNDQRLTLLDWGDAGVGHPLLDQSAFLDRLPSGYVEPARAHWHAAWRRLLPLADVESAARLLAPVAALRQALIYQRFLDGIEDAEHPYHRADVGIWLRRTVDQLAVEAAG